MRAQIAVLAATATAIAALGLPAAAAAKEIASVQACGADGCDDVTGTATPAVLDGGGRGNPPAGAAPFYRFKVVVKAGHERARWSFLYVPSAEKVRGDDGTWMNPATPTLHALDRLTRGREPLPASRLALPTPGEASAPPPPAASSGSVPAAAWAFGIAGAAALAVCGLILVIRRRGPTAA